MVAMAAKNEFVASKTIRTDSGDQWVLSYYVQIFQNDNGGEYYGLRVEKHPMADAQIAEAEDTGGVTESRDEIYEMAHAFAAGTVTPVTLLEMTDDRLSS